MGVKAACNDYFGHNKGCDHFLGLAQGPRPIPCFLPSIVS